MLMWLGDKVYFDGKTIHKLNIGEFFGIGVVLDKYWCICTRIVCRVGGSKRRQLFDFTVHIQLAAAKTKGHINETPKGVAQLPVSVVSVGFSGSTNTL